MKNKRAWLLAFLIELLNALLSFIGGRSQVNKCPRSGVMPTISVVLSLAVLAILTTLIVKNAKKHKWLIVALGILSFIFVVGIGLILWVFADGGLDWCNFISS